MLDKIIKDTRPKMEQAIDHFAQDIKSIHTGRSSASLVEDITVNHYNAMMPIKQVATITVPDANIIVVTPWDKGALQPIETAIRESGLQISPVNDGTAIRLVLPPMSTERRTELTKIIQKKAEEVRIALRTVREDAWKEVQRLEKANQITQDDKYRGEEQLNKMTSELNKKVDQIARHKETEIMSV
ncbi:ribosome recycling factor [Candidatus Berkelbacteria bacterium CG2_30_43_20]|nr:MAG: ribosome recycling factor [Candidatus Berkelbacteria bacterium CG2_30_43_20]